MRNFVRGLDASVLVVDRAAVDAHLPWGVKPKTDYAATPNRRSCRDKSDGSGYLDLVHDLRDAFKMENGFLRHLLEEEAP